MSPANIIIQISSSVLCSSRCC